METIDIFKALQILKWLKNPEQHFTPLEGVDMNKIGVSFCQIKEKLNMTQMSTSHYLTILLRTKVIMAEHLGKCTYYKRDEDAIKRLVDV